MVGSRLGSYEITGLLGKGGMGEVYRARDTKLGRDVAIKVLPSEFSRDSDRLSRFRREAQVLASLNHPNILAIYDVGAESGTQYVVSELLEGETFGAILQRGALPVRRVIDYAVQLAKGLAAAHSKGVVHRDLKPENLFLTRDGLLKILDFGLAKQMDTSIDAAVTNVPTSVPTEIGAVLGTVGYMSPEQAHGVATDHRADIFSFGTICYEMLTGQRAFRGESSLDVMNAIVRQDPPEISQIKPDVPVAIERVVTHCLAKSPDDRFQSARDLVFALESLTASSMSPVSTVQPAARPPQQRRSTKWIGLAALLVVAALAVWFFSNRLANNAALPNFHRVTFRQGTIWSARFAPDGRTIVYSAAWNRRPVELFSTSLDSPESRSLGFDGADILALSPSSEMAVLLKDGSHLDWGWKLGTLARASLAGGAPREESKAVALADWGPDGSSLAIVRLMGTRTRVEFPIGKALYETGDRVGALRISPKGNVVAFAERPFGLGGSWSVATLDLNGKKQIVSSGWVGEFIDVAWSADGSEIWFNTRQGGDGSIHAVTLSGDQRLLTKTTIPLQLFDVARDGRALVARVNWRAGILGLAPGSTTERDFSWLDASELDDISHDGTSLLLTEFGEGGGEHWSVYLRKTDDSPAVRLGDGQAFALSPDGSRALALRRSSPHELVLWPTGAGEPITIKNENITDYYWGDWLPDGKQIIFSGAEAGHAPRCYIQSIDGGKPRAITPEGTTLRVGQRAISPDGQWAIVMASNGKASLYPINGGEPRSIPGLEPGDVPIRWTVDESSLMVFRKSESEPAVYVVDLATGRNTLWKTILPADAAGVIDVWGVHIAPDEKSYYYSYLRSLSDLYVVDRLK